MARSQFFPGQRWISNTEAELGLGVVVEQTGRSVTLNFPAVDEQRTYAVTNAPLSRVEYPVGDRIQSTNGIELQITERQELNGCLFYHGVDQNGDQQTLAELELDSRVRFSKPQDRLFAGQVDKNSAFRLRVETLEHQYRHRRSEVYGLLGGRVQLLPHQFYIASQVTGRAAPRVLLADEVGLGKTVEAGLIMHQLLFSDRAKRVLVVVPDSLVHQWLVEMLRRFNLRFSILDPLRCTAMEMADDGNPFESAQLVICSLSFLTGDDDRRRAALEAGWDLMVVDEAHHLGWSEEAASHSYLAIEELARAIPGLLLLTATPEQLGPDGHFARLRLLDPDRYHDLRAFREEESEYRTISNLVERLQAEDVRSQLHDAPDLVRALEHYLGSEAVERLRSELEQGDIGHLIEDAIGNLLDRHGTGRVLFRNTRDAVKGFPRRELYRYPMSLPPAYGERLADAAVENTLHPEVLFDDDDWLEWDPRVTWLLDWLRDHRDDKALVICARKETAKALEKQLRLYEGVRAALFHEGMSLLERDRAAAYFAEEDDSAQVLICSEIGSEGRNFQFAHHLVMFDLPLNPDLLEQRIGRLDRIGQRHDVQIHVPYFDESPQAVLLNWFDLGINAFNRSCPAAQPLFQAFAPRLQALMEDFDEPALQQLLDDTRHRAEELEAELQAGRDRLLELNSCQPEPAARILEEVAEASRSLELAGYMERVFDLFGVEQQTHGADSVVLTPGDHMPVSSLPGLPEDGITATYQRSLALSREDMQFLTWEHPLVSGAMELLADGDYGNTSLCSLNLPPLPAGTLLIEAFYRLHCVAPKSMQLQRYLSQGSVRLVLDSNGNDLTGIIAHGHLNKLAERVPRRTAQTVVNHARAQIAELVEKADAKASAQNEGVRTEAVAKAEARFAADIERLQALAKVNPAIRESDVEALRNQRKQVLAEIEQVELKLDALRVAVVS
ncbi:MAG: RNA polymerase-associated protein RapA [Oceanospirillaceae bacterium]|nr:RNA polymerase-associated protein RapA [Oceanospirillaceae bacterium]